VAETTGITGTNIDSWVEKVHNMLLRIGISSVRVTVSSVIILDRKPRTARLLPVMHYRTLAPDQDSRWPLPRGLGAASADAGTKGAKEHLTTGGHVRRDRGAPEPAPGPAPAPTPAPAPSSTPPLVDMAREGVEDQQNRVSAWDTMVLDKSTLSTPPAKTAS
jgi:hypothetical protein